MDRDTVIALAQEAGLPYMYETGEVANLGLVEFFAALVAAHEREQCAKIAQAWDVAYPTTNYGQCIANEIRSRT